MIQHQNPSPSDSSLQIIDRSRGSGQLEEFESKREFLQREAKMENTIIQEKHSGSISQITTNAIYGDNKCGDSTAFTNYKKKQSRAISLITVDTIHEDNSSGDSATFNDYKKKQHNDIEVRNMDLELQQSGSTIVSVMYDKLNKARALVNAKCVVPLMVDYSVAFKEADN